MNKRYWLVVQIFIALILMAVLLTGCGKKGVVSTSGLLTEITVAAAVDEEGRPLHPTTVFATDADAFYCSFKVNKAPPDTEIKGEWIYVSGPVEEQIGGKNYVMEEQSYTIEGTRYDWVCYLRPNIPNYEWPVGDCKVVLYVNGKEDASMPFTVKEKANEASSSLGVISNVAMSAAVDSRDRPVKPTSVFPTDAKKFYCSFKLSGFSPGSRIEAEWTYVGGETGEKVPESFMFQEQTGTYVIQWQTGTVGGDEGYTSIFLESPTSDYIWPKGDYKVILYGNNQEKASVFFKVE